MGTTNTLDLNNRVTNLEKAVSGGDSAQANKKDIATEFSATTAYTAGCFVYYQGKLYQFNTDHAAGAWDSTDVVEANVTDQIVSNKAAIEGLTASDIMMSDGVTSVEDAISSIGSVLYEYTAGINETWSSALDHLYGHTGLNTAILLPNIGLIFMPSVSNRYGAIYLNSSGKLISAAIHIKQSGSMYYENAADTTTVTDVSSNAFTQGYKMQVIKMY